MARKKKKRAGHKKTKRRRKKVHHKKRHTPKWSASKRRSYKAAKRALISKFNRM